MKKSEALAIFGGSVQRCAETLGITVQAVGQWPDDLPTRISDRVLGAAFRRGLLGPTKQKPREDTAA